MIVEQLALLDPDPPDFRLDDETKERGLTNVERARRILAAARSRRNP